MSANVEQTILQHVKIAAANAVPEFTLARTDVDAVADEVAGILIFRLKA